MNLRGNRNRRLSRQLRMVVSHDHSGWSNRLHVEFRQTTLRGLELVTVAAAATAADLRLGGLDGQLIQVWSNERNLLVFGDLLHNFAADHRSADNQSDDDHMHHRRAKDTAALIVVKTPDVAYRLRLRSELQRR